MTVLPGDGLSPVPTTSSTYFSSLTFGSFSALFSCPVGEKVLQRATPIIARATIRAMTGNRFDFDLTAACAALPRAGRFGFAAKTGISFDYKLVCGKRENADEYTDLSGRTQQLVIRH